MAAKLKPRVTEAKQGHPHRLTVRLTALEHRQLRNAARVAGVTPVELMRRVIANMAKAFDGDDT